MKPVALFTLIAASPLALAQVVHPPAILSDLTRCRSLVQDEARLRCYDAAADTLANATSSGSLILVDKNDVRRTRRSLFGLNLPKMPFFGGDASAEEEVQEINAKITSARVGRDDKWLVELDTAGTWQATEVDTRQSPPKTGDSVRIRKASLGGFLLSVEGRRSVRAMRVR